MTLAERNKLIKQIFEDECFSILETKGADYMNADAWDQFENLASIIGVSPLQIMYIYMNKHIRAVETAMQNKSLRAESLEDKLKDIANYALLMIAYNRKM